MKMVIATENAPAAVGPYSQAVRAGEYLFIAGQLGIDPADGKLVDGGVERIASILSSACSVCLSTPPSTS
ncbi:MAG: hypothetical protein KAX13_10145, partial [Candidatus Krumholzibacteria bacterium]|nr:hypothetical protein [Candidatus Krumholzibacteria bacterium]